LAQAARHAAETGNLLAARLGAGLVVTRLPGEVGGATVRSIEKRVADAKIELGVAAPLASRLSAASDETAGNTVVAWRLASHAVR
jgi:hypothetical protein